MVLSGVEQLNLCATKIIKSINEELSFKSDFDYREKKEFVFMLEKLANLFLKIKKLQELDDESTLDICVEDKSIIQKFLQNYKKYSKSE